MTALVLEVAGAALVSLGAFLIFLPAGFVVAGGFLLAFGLATAKAGE